MLNFIIIAVGLAGWIEGGWVWGLTMLVMAFLLSMLAMTIVSGYRHWVYRDEFIACTNAMWANNERAVDEVNRWTIHYYVHKAFSMSSGRDGVDVGYRYSIRERPRESGGGVGGDFGFIWF
jgi:hypothetical protein